MRGFQPQNFADGGLVQGVKRFFGMDEEHNARVAAYRAQKAQEKAQQQAAQAQQAKSATAPAPALSEYAGMGAMQRREKAAGLADGGLVRGPGTGTSDDVPDEVREGTYIMPADSTKAVGAEQLATMGARGFQPGGKKVPVNLSNGEFKIPPEQVHAIGVQALDQMKDATHQPVRGFAPKAQPDEPRQFFADGGVALGMKRLYLADAGVVTRKRLEEEGRVPGDMEIRPNSFGDAAAAAQNSGVAQVGGLANNGGADAARFAQVPAPIGTQPNRTPDVAPQPQAAPASPPAVQPAEPPAPVTTAPLGQKHSIGARSGAQMLADGLDSGARAFFDSFQKAPEPSPAPAAPRGMPSYKTDVQRGGGNVPAIDTVAPPSAAAPAAAPGPGEVTKVGNSYSGTNVSGDISINGQAPRNGGQVSAQNMAAADGLAARSQQESMARVAAQPAVGFQPAGVTAPVVQHSGNSWQARNDLRNLQVSASSIMNNGGPWDKHKGVSPEQAAYAAAMASDLALKGAQPVMDQAAMRENAGIQREGMQQAGAAERSARGFAVEQQRLGIDKRRANSEIEARGLSVRQGQRQEKLYERYDAAKTPEERAAVAQQIRDLSGKATNPKDDLMTVGGGQEWDSTANVMRNVPQRIFDARTRQYVDGRIAGNEAKGPAQPASKAEYDALPKGAQYIKDGKVMVKG